MSDTPEMIPVRVEWYDAHVGSEGWIGRDEIETEPYVVVSCGFLITEAQGGKPEHLTITMSWALDDMLHSVSHIPIQMVRKYEVLMRSDELGNAPILSA